MIIQFSFFFRDVEVNVGVCVCVNVVEQKLFSLNMVKYVAGICQISDIPNSCNNIIFQFFKIDFSIFSRYCYKQYHLDAKGRRQRRAKKIGVAVNCTLQDSYNITKQDLEDNLFPLRPSLVPANSITCNIKRYILIYIYYVLVTGIKQTQYYYYFKSSFLKTYFILVLTNKPTKV